MPIIAETARLVTADTGIKTGDTVLVVGQVARLDPADGAEILAGALVRFASRVPGAGYYVTVPLTDLVVLREE